MAEILINSYAKINWTLDVLFKREDGYHELRTIYQSVSLHDRLRLTATEGAIEIVCHDPAVPCDETNLAHQAACTLREATGAKGGARIEIEKRIPVAAGLGGGSSNAASVLQGLMLLWRVEIDERDLQGLAARLGSDVPFFLVGGTALGVGRGEEVYPLEDVQCEFLLLANPGIAVSTANAYAKLSRLTRVESPRIIPFSLEAARALYELPLKARNDFDEVVTLAHPEIAALQRQLVELGAKRALVSGSGATVFAVFDNLATREQAQTTLREAGIWASGVRTINRREYRAGLFGGKQPGR